MLKLKRLLLCLFLTRFSFAATIAEMPDGWVDGAGGEISNLAELRWLSITTAAWDENWVITADIDASDTKTWNDDGGALGPQGFSPIGDVGWGGRQAIYFSGNLDGRGHVISNLYINRPNEDYVGLLGAATGSAEIKNIGLKNTSVAGYNFVGGLVGEGGPIQISNSFVEGSVSTDRGYVGGLVGQADGSAITECFSKGSVEGKEGIVGGLVGNLRNGTVLRSFSTAQVTGERSVGGIAGIAQVSGSVENSFSMGNISGSFWVGGLVGANHISIVNSYASGAVTADSLFGGVVGLNTRTGTISGGVFDSDKAGTTIGVGEMDTVATASGLTSSDFSNSENFSGWDFDATWKVETYTPLDSLPRPQLRWLKKVEFFVEGDGTLDGEVFQIVAPVFSTTPVIANPNVGNYLSRWKDGSNQRNLSGSTVVLDNVQNDEFITAVFAPFEYDVQFSALEGGRIDGEASQRVAYNRDASLVSAEAFEGYTFVQWQDSTGHVASNSNQMEIKAVRKDSLLYAYFERNIYSVEFQAGENGVLSGTTTQNVTHGEDADAVTAKPNEGYFFLEWQDSKGNRVSTDNPFQLSNVKRDSSLTAVFTMHIFEVAFHSDENGSIKGDTLQQVGHGLYTTEVEAVVDQGYRFAGWVDSLGTIVTQNNPLILTNVLKDTSLTATYSIESYKVEFSSEKNGRVEGDSIQQIAYQGSSSEVKAVAMEGYQFLEWQDLSGNTISNENPFTLSQVERDTVVIASFEVLKFKLTFTTSSGGSISGVREQTVEFDFNSTEMTAIPDSGLVFDQWVYTNGDFFSSENPLVLKNVKQDYSLEAKFKAKSSFLIQFESDGNGWIEGELTQQIQLGDSTTPVEAIPKPFFLFEGWGDSTGIFSTSNPLLLDSVYKDQILYAFFSKVKFKVDAHIISFGARLDQNSNVIAHGDTVKFDLNLSEGHKLDSITYNGAHVMDRFIQKNGVMHFESIVTEDGILKVYVSEDHNASLHFDAHLLSAININRVGEELQLSSEEKFRYVLYTVHGTKVRESASDSRNQWNVSLNKVLSGVYFLRVENSKGFGVQRITLQP